MIIQINPIDWGETPKNTILLKDMGLEYNVPTLYKVIDKQLFFLTVIKYGITYKEWHGIDYDLWYERI